MKIYSPEESILSNTGHELNISFRLQENIISFLHLSVEFESGRYVSLIQVALVDRGIRSKTKIITLLLADWKDG
jgi:hypothetical protein